MDPIQSQTQQQNSPQQPTQSNSNLPPSQPPTDNKKPLFLILLFLFAIVIVVTVVIFLAYPKAPSSNRGETVNPPILSPTESVSQEEQDLQKIDLGDIDKDLQDIQADVEQL